jgi:predicted Zn finger-like uncharacterized protein
MRLATRCPSCATMFLVVQDQLRVSEGWVRCGRCANVFNAVDDLIDVDQGNPVQLDLASLQPGARPGEPVFRGPSLNDGSGYEAAAPAPPATAPREPADHLDDDFDMPDDPGAASAQPSLGDDPWTLQPPLSDAPAAGHAPRDPAMPDRLLRTPSQPDDDDLASSIAPGGGSGWSTLTPAEPPPSPAIDSLPDPRPDAAPSDLPNFVRNADRAERWKRSPMRAGLGLAALLLLLLAAAQMALLWRDNLAARLPALAPALQAACLPWGCQVQPLRRIDQLAVDSSSLVRVDDEPFAVAAVAASGSNGASSPAASAGQRYRLSVLLHNRADTAVMAPAIELALTDGRGELVTRRVLQMADFGAAPGALSAGQELPLRLLLATGTQRIEGYTVELFYP